MKKNKIIIGSSIAAVAVLAIGAFAYLSDSDSDSETGKVGVVDVSASTSYDEADYYGNKSTDDDNTTVFNMNPGDNDPSNPSGSRPGTDHELTINVSNDGTKSVITRTVITVTGKDADGNVLPSDKLTDLLIGINPNPTGLGDTASQEGKEGIEVLYSYIYTGEGWLSAIDNPNSLVYVLGGTDEKGLVLSGSEEKETVHDYTPAVDELGNLKYNLRLTFSDNGDGTYTWVELGQQITDISSIEQYLTDKGNGIYEAVIPGVLDEEAETFTCDFASLPNMSKIALDSNPMFEQVMVASDATHEAPTSSSLIFEIGLNHNADSIGGAEFSIKVEVQAMQYRNTNDGDWNTLFSNTYQINVAN